MLVANGSSFFPAPSRYAVWYEGESPYTAMEFASKIKSVLSRNYFYVLVIFFRSRFLFHFFPGE